MIPGRAERVKLALGQIEAQLARGELAGAEALARRLVAEHPLTAPAQRGVKKRPS